MSGFLDFEKIDEKWRNLEEFGKSEEILKMKGFLNFVCE
jgi:hypothetical protein